MLTVRRGYETAWTRFVKANNLTSTIPLDHPYLQIAKEIANYDGTNYPDLPPAYPGGSSGAQLDPVLALCSQAVKASVGPAGLVVDSSAGSITDLPVVIDSNASDVVETQTVKALPDLQHITVGALAHDHDGTKTPFAYTSPAIRGADWGVVRVHPVRREPKLPLGAI